LEERETSITATREIQAKGSVQPDHERSAEIADTGTAWYALGGLALALCSGLYRPPIAKSDPRSDQALFAHIGTDFSFIQGTAFVSAYLIAIPFVGRLADVANRRNVLVSATVIRSICTPLCGMAHSYDGLFGQDSAWV
jgi:MFS family permease